MKRTYSFQAPVVKLITNINHIYEDCEWLRDCATEEEKEYWNKTRGIFYDADKHLRKLDNSLSEGRALDEY